MHTPKGSCYVSFILTVVTRYIPNTHFDEYLSSHFVAKISDTNYEMNRPRHLNNVPAITQVCH